ncbi:MAG: L-2-amino-thiazoline-4-carboxylic acid hydrolase [bacterium]|nr:L-2-amino-thiazoline-4-carboxylic acid hydrolase [bacterium]
MVKTGKELKDAIKSRAMAYAFIYEEMKEKLGAKKAGKIFSESIYKLGESKCGKYKKALKKGGLKALAKEFVKSSPLNGKIFNPGIEKVNENECVLIMKACPLVEAWKENNFSDEKIKALCDIAYQIDLGTFQACGLNIEFTHRIGDGNSKCRLILSKTL